MLLSLIKSKAVPESLTPPPNTLPYVRNFSITHLKQIQILDTVGMLQRNQNPHSNPETISKLKVHTQFLRHNTLMIFKIFLVKK